MMRKLIVAALLACRLASAAGNYEVVAGWPALPKGVTLGVCAGVAVSADNRVFVFHRNERQWKTPFPDAPIADPTVAIIDGASGRLLAQWGANRFIMPHGLAIDDKGNVWLTDVGLQQVFKTSQEGRPLLTLGEAKVAGEDRTHFNLPTDVAVLPDGSFYVSDGYRNSRVVKFDANGGYLFEWGTKGEGEGQFHLPHGLTIDAERNVYVCDRENLRVQVFDPQGRFRHVWPGSSVGHPYGIDASPDGHLFVIDGGLPKVRKSERGKVVELDAEGRVITRFGSYGSAPGQFETGHDIAVGPDGAVYVAEAGGRRVQKFVRPKTPGASPR